MNSSSEDWPPQCYGWGSGPMVNITDCENLLSAQHKLDYFRVRKTVSTEKRLSLKNPQLSPRCEIRVIGKVHGRTDEFSLEDAVWTARSILDYCSPSDTGGYLGFGVMDLFNLQVIGLVPGGDTEPGVLPDLVDALAQAESETGVETMEVPAPAPTGQIN